MSEGTDGLLTLTEDGRVPHTRMCDCLEASYRIQQMMNAEKRGRSGRRALVKGLVDGNPPYRAVDLKRAGRANQCNVNWRVSEMYLNQARGAYYDVFSESPSFATIRTGWGNSDQQEMWSRIITEEFQWLLMQDTQWDYVNQISNYEMVLYGSGPIVFTDDSDWRNEAVLNQNLIVSDFTLSDVNRWEEAVIVRDYKATELYDFIRKEDAARAMGWNIEATKQAIMQAHPKIESGGQYSSWEWHQQMLKNKSYWYSAQSKVIQCVHYYFREFPLPGEEEGRITHCVVPNPEGFQQTQTNYLFQHIGRFRSWLDIVHPMYSDNDGGGYHHSVTGMGVKMYSAMEYQNRLLCNLADKTFAPKILFRPTTANANEQLNIIQFGDYGKVPAQFEVQQIPIGSYLEDGLVFHREMSRLVSSNLSSYTPSLTKESGNPITAYEASIRASEQARLGKTQLNHYYNQLDRLYEVKFLRATCPRQNGFKPGGGLAKQFQDKCAKRGVPRIALEHIESVKATRITGQGSQFMRQQGLEKLLGTLALWTSEAGRNNLLSDYIASIAGQALVDRYNPDIDIGSSVADQRAFAVSQVAGAKVGVPPQVTGTQNNLVFASTFLSAAGDAAKSLEQGGNPQEVYAFLDAIMPALAQHLEKASADPTRGNVVEQMQRRWADLAQFHDKLGKMLEQQAMEQQKGQQTMQRAQAIHGGTDPEFVLKASETKAKLDLSAAKTRHQMQLRQQAADQKLRNSDLQSGQKMVISDLQSASKIQLQQRESAVKDKNGSKEE